MPKVDVLENEMEGLKMKVTSLKNQNYFYVCRWQIIETKLDMCYDSSRFYKNKSQLYILVHVLICIKKKQFKLKFCPCVL